MRVVAFFCFVLAAAGAPVRAADALPHWMAGTWLSCANGEQVVEHWIGGQSMLLGTNLTRGKKRETFEFLRVAQNERGGLSYFAMPGGKSATAFDMVVHKDGRAEFENRAHDFPKKIIYRRDGDKLHARIEGVIGGKTEGTEWSFTAAAVGQGCKP